ncbi:uncharacterized protein [Salvelinus alpinus]|uniref:uncharacterized protein isoform X2 n=1 Tax=Salvelinus alpinus TaxID=8036 RepID=UPI0039FDB63E
MEAVLGLLVISAGVSHGLETSCDAREDGSQCYGALGGTVYLQLVTDATRYAPVSSPQLSSECLSHGEMRVSCSSEGDGTQYSWTLDGQTLRDTETSPGEETNTITLKKGLSGNLTCTIRNYISSDTVSRRILPCPGLIYVNCTSSNGTRVSEWVNATGNTLCVESTTVATVTVETTTVATVATVESPTSKTSTEHSAEISSWAGTGFNVFVYFQLAEVIILLTICLGSYCFYKKKTCPQEKDDGE